LIISDYKYWMFIALGFLNRLFRASKLILTFADSKTKYNIFYKKSAWLRTSFSQHRIDKFAKGHHPGMDCRGLGYTEVNPAITLPASHIPTLWIPAIHNGMMAT